MGFQLFAQQDISHINARKFIRQVLLIYSPEEYAMLETYYRTPSEFTLSNATFKIGRHIDFLNYIMDTTRKDLAVNSVPVMVHEMTHLYANRRAYALIEKRKLSFAPGDKYLCISLDTTREILVKLKPTPPARFMAATVPELLRENKYYDFIATDNETVMPQKEGIYGLLDEWHAYMHSARVAFSLHRFYEREAFYGALTTDYSEQPLHDDKPWKDFFANFYEMYLPYIEFKYYILQYLAYCKQHQPEVYDYIIFEDRAFRAAYKAIDEAYKQVIEQFRAYKPRVIELLTKLSIEVSEENMGGQYFMFINEAGIATYQSLYEAFEKEIQKQELSEIDFYLKQ
ncbi:hypothetical protein FHS56_000619 [Thermonema lapsum]|uniref:Uncharacterized protein n=1 Tax=Thermonema lapsum TaxID=28195 RepID=A0A846MNK2_9BACT|nr:hypothetical protein [Thermonema lapsum]NIK73133.1 hypothetical protein [Thermonema lapsum]